MVRQATIDDFDALLALLRRLAQESTETGVSAAQVSMDHVAMSLDAFLRNPACCFFVESDGGEIKGVLALIRMPHLLTGTTLVAELCWWVNGESRGYVGMKLLGAAEAWTRQHAGVLQLSVVSDAMKRVLTRQGYRAGATTYERRMF